MLPTIIEVADKYGLACNERTRKQKNVRYKCPFCKGDLDQPKKYYLSLNQNKNIYWCWWCKANGVVLAFETNISGKSYTEVKESYFGRNKNRSYHPAEILSPQQLQVIGWDEVKRKDYKQFKRLLEEVYSDWCRYADKERAIAFAKLLIGIKIYKYELVIENIKRQSETVFVETLLEDVLEMYSSDLWTEWAKEGLELAHVALGAAKKAGQVQEALMYLLFATQMKLTEATLKNVQ